MTTPHIHASILHAIADGKRVEVMTYGAGWIKAELHDLIKDSDCTFRIAPEAVLDVEVLKPVVTDTQLLDFLEKEHFSNVFPIGSTWYSRIAYGQPYRKHKTLRDAITTAIKQKRKTSPAEAEILRRDPGATFKEDGTVNTCLEYGELQDIFNSYRE